MMITDQRMNIFYRLREEKKLQKKKFVRKIAEELRNAKSDIGIHTDQYLRIPSSDQMNNLMNKNDSGI
jgi:hypothetical protein